MSSSVKGSIVPAAILAAITLFVFTTLRDFGPESAVRRFHEDIVSQNLADLQRVCTESVNSPNVERMGQILQMIDEAGASPRLASMERTPNEVDVLVLYQLNGGQYHFVWVVTKRDIGWMVDPYQTLLANPNSQTG